MHCGDWRTYEVAGDEVFPVKVAVLAVREDGEVLGEGNQAAEEESNVGSP